MNKLCFLLLAMLFTSHAALTYTVDTDRSGFSSIALSLEEEQEASMTLPGDASNFRIGGGSYSIVNDTAYIEAGSTGFATFSFSSDMLTTKTDSGWKLLFFPPEEATVLIYMPPYATIESAFPQPKRVQSENSRMLVEMEYAKTVTVYYSLEEQPILSYESESSALYVLAFAIVIAAVAIAFSLRGSGRQMKPEQERKPTLGMTPGKKGMMETFNENDLKIVGFLLESGGKSKRNTLERQTEVSKSSLAMALRRLEKRKIIEMDRTATTHFVKLSDYFLRL